MTRTRPLLGEPLALDLVNTAWVEQDAWVDFFDDPGGTEAWLAEHGLQGEADQARKPLVAARDALRAALVGREGPLDAVLDHGSRRPRLRGRGRTRRSSSTTRPGMRHGWRRPTSSA
ncbi:ABATE domain-containing protein [Nonomuraea recticatena]|uniref:ABATE domain-containing protein n=1 Tax=Nonomuraea recticatena TaxID=46178 RepID=UPI0036152394